MNIALQLINRAKQYPDAPAITADGQTTSFAELANRVTRIAGSMQDSLGIIKGERVLLWMENRREFVETMFACWAAGACVVPVNPKLHGKEVAHILRDSGARTLFTTESLQLGVAENIDEVRNKVKILVAGSSAYESLTNGPGMASCDVAATDPAWIFYTSGTTGFPKGAVLSHRNLLFMMLAYYADIEQVETGQTMLHAAALSHGSGQYLLPHLLAGGHQVLMRKFDPFEVLQAFEKYPAVSMFAVPTMVTRLIHGAAGKAGCAGNLRTIIYGGAPMYVSDLIKAIEVFGLRLFQLYGQGESPMTISGLRKREHEGTQDQAHLARPFGWLIWMYSKIVAWASNLAPVH